MALYTQISRFVRLEVDSEVQGILVLLVSWALWKPICAAINEWRMHRRRQKYPQLVVCRRVVEKSTNGTGKQQFTIMGWLISSVGTIVVSVLPFLIMVPLKGLQLFLAWVQDVILSSRKRAKLPVGSVASRPPPANNNINNQIPTPSGQAGQAHQLRRSTTPPLSVLRKTGSSSSNSTQNNARVEFAEHSNGSIRTERCYYNPSMQPSRSIQPTPTRAADTSPSPAVPANQAVVHPHQHWSSQTSPSRPVSSWQLTHQGDVVQLDRGKFPTRPNDFSPTTQNYSPYDTSKMVEYRRVTTAMSRPIAVLQTPLSEQMRKRRFEEGSDSNASNFLATKSPCLGGRVRLGGIQPRIISTRRSVLKKREREEREDRILKDLNMKRIKKRPVEKEPTKSTSNTLTNTKLVHPSSKGLSPTTAPSTEASSSAPAPATTFQFGSSPAVSAPGDLRDAESNLVKNSQPDSSGAGTIPSLPGDRSNPPIRDGAANAPGFSFGGAAVPTTTTTEPTPAATGGFSFGGLSNASQKNDTNPAPPPPSFAFGSAAPTLAPDAPTSTAPSEEGFSFGSLSNASQKNNTNPAQPPPSFAFGSAAPTLASDAPTSTAPSEGGFAFGNLSNASQKNDTNPAQPPPSFAFGSAAPTLASDAPTSTAPSEGGFPIGDTPAPALASSSSTGFSFGGAPLSTQVLPAPSVSFGGALPAISAVQPPPTIGGALTVSYLSDKLPSSAIQVAAQPLQGGGLALGAIPGGGASARRRAKSRTGRRGR